MMPSKRVLGFGITIPRLASSWISQLKYNSVMVAWPA